MSQRDQIDEQELLLADCLVTDLKIFTKVASILEPQYFEAPLDTVVEFVLEYFNEYKDVPSPKIVHAATGIKLVKQELSESEAKYIVDAFEEFCQNSAMRIAINNAIDLMQENELTAIREEVKKALQVSLDKNIGMNQFENPRARLEAMQVSLDARSIGWHGIDELIDYIKRTELYIFAANSGVGKSITLANLAVNMSNQGLHGLYITLELAEELVTKRLDSMFTEVPVGAVFDSIDDIDEIYEQLKKECGSLYVKRLPAGSKAQDIHTYLNEYMLQTGIKPDYICLDYIDLMAPNEKMTYGNAFDRDKAISEQFREILAEFHLYGFTASQLNRSAVDVQEKNQAHISGGMSKINTADVAISISRSNENKDNGEMVFQALKLRNSAFSEKTVSLYLDSTTLRLIEKKEHMKTKMHSKNEENQQTEPGSPKKKLRALLNDMNVKKKS